MVAGKGIAMNLSPGMMQCFMSSCKNILKWLEDLP